MATVRISEFGPGNVAVDPTNGAQIVQSTGALALAAVTNQVINVSAAGDNDAIAAQTGKVIYVLRGRLIAADAVDVAIKQGSTVIAGPMHLEKGGGFNIEPPEDYRLADYVTAVGTKVVINLSAAVQVGGHLKYIAV